MSLVELRLLKAGRPVLDGVALDVFAGELLAVIGPNGAGKSSALKCLGGVETAWSGRIELEGCPLADFPAEERARRIAYLPQFFAPHWELSVADLLDIGQQRGRTALGWSAIRPPALLAVDVAEQADGLLRDLELNDLLERRFASLSGGERARALLAQALVTAPRLLLADEPTASLDPAHQLRTMEYLRGCRGETASIVVLHDLNLALRFADRIAVLADGRTVACGKVHEVVASGILTEVFGVRFEVHATSWGRAVLPV
ncbi:MAG: ABC transporter ATP-binding protein [Thermoanaerobaculia bacterium]|nr:ABC transporter ATP-binding protein [Thermoanaerobaculia bacterium]